MYIWLGIEVEGQLAAAKERALAVEREMGFGLSCFTLPMHVSLKMSFPMDDARAPEVMEFVKGYYAALSPFLMRVRGPEADGPILWIRMERSAELDRIHDELNEQLLLRYGVGLHEYDTDYKFHTTLFMDGDEARIREAYSRIQDVCLPETLTASRFVIGTSETGALGSYSVCESITVG